MNILNKSSNFLKHENSNFLMPNQNTENFKLNIHDLFKLLNNTADILLVPGDKGKNIYVILYMLSDEKDKLGTYFPIALINHNQISNKNIFVQNFKKDLQNYFTLSKVNPKKQLHSEFFNFFEPTRCAEKGFKLTPEAISLFLDLYPNEEISIKKESNIDIPVELLKEFDNNLKKHSCWKEQLIYNIENKSIPQTQISKEELNEILNNADNYIDLTRLSNEEIINLAQPKLNLIKKLSSVNLQKVAKEYENEIHYKLKQEHIDEKSKIAGQQLKKIQKTLKDLHINQMSQENQLTLLNNEFSKIHTERNQKMTNLDHYNSYIKKIKILNKKLDYIDNTQNEKIISELMLAYNNKDKFLKNILNNYVSKYMLHQKYLIQKYVKLKNDRELE